MIRTFWNNLRSVIDGAPVPLTIGDQAATGVLHQCIDLATIQNRGDLAGIEVEVTTGVVNPTAVNLTVFYAFSTKQNRTPTQLLTAAASQACLLPAAANAIRVYTLPLNYQSAQYLHIWFDQEAPASGSLITIELSVVAKNAN